MLSDYKPLVGNKNFLYLWTSQLLSQLAINIMNFLLLIKLFNATGSTIATSFLWVVYSLPALFVGPFSSASIDMVSKKKVLMITNLLQAISIFLYSLVHGVSVFLVYGVALAYSLLNQFYVPAELASVPSLVKKRNLAHANGLFFITQQSALVLGFGVAGMLLRAVGFRNSLFLCSAFLTMAFAAVSFLPKMKTKDAIPKNIEKAFMKFFKRILEGYRLIKGERVILAPLLLLIGLQVALVVVAVNTPKIAVELLRLSVDLAGVFVVVPAGIGAGIAAVVAPKLIKRKIRKNRLIKYSIMMIVLSLLVLAFMVMELNFVFGLTLAVLTIIIIGFSFITILISAQTFLQEKTPGGYRGRVFGNFWFLSTVATIFPVIVSGAITELFGARFLAATLAVVLFSVLLYIRKYGESFLVVKKN